jgi:hypothetical protein
MKSLKNSTKSKKQMKLERPEDVVHILLGLFQFD